MLENQPSGANEIFVDDSGYSDDLAKKKLLNAYNHVLSEVATEYVPLKTTSTFSGGKVLFSAFPLAPLKIYRAEYLNGNVAPFTLGIDYIVLPDRETTVTYSYIPAEVTSTSVKFAYENTKVGKRVFLYGVAAEYCMITGRFDEAADWEAKYRAAIASAMTSGAKRIKARKWGI